MFRRQAVPPGLVGLARQQSFVVSREQALGFGLSDASTQRLIGAGWWTRLAAGVYFTAPVDVPWEAQAWAGVLIGGDRARLGGLAAGYLHGLREDPPQVIDVLVPASGSRPRSRGVWSFRRERPRARSSRTIGAPPRITVEDTVLDLCAGCGREDAVGWVTAALQNRVTTTERLAQAVRSRHFVPQRSLLTDLLVDTADGVRSVLERRYLHDVERAHGLPTARRQVRRRGTEADAWYEEFALLVELDGLRGHAGAGRLRDMRRDNVATTDGLASLRYGPQDVFGRPCEVAFQVAGVLGDRGWPGPVQWCRRCQRVA